MWTPRHLVLLMLWAVDVDGLECFLLIPERHSGNQTGLCLSYQEVVSCGNALQASPDSCWLLAKNLFFMCLHFYKHSLCLVRVALVWVWFTVTVCVVGIHASTKVYVIWVSSCIWSSVQLDNCSYEHTSISAVKALLQFIFCLTEPFLHSFHYRFCRFKFLSYRLWWDGQNNNIQVPRGARCTEQYAVLIMIWLCSSRSDDIIFCGGSGWAGCIYLCGSWLNFAPRKLPKDSEKCMWCSSWLTDQSGFAAHHLCWPGVINLDDGFKSSMKEENYCGE